MITMPTWDAFRHKFQSEVQQREKFEDLARSLFCLRFGIKYGIFQCINHAGNETDTINDGTDIIGFQAKFFKHEIDDNNIIESIQIAHRHNPLQTKVIIYTNLTFGNPPAGKAKTIKQEKIEKAASNIGISIEWNTDNMILDQVSRNQWVYDIFFGIEPNLQTLISEEQTNTNEILAPINSSICINEQLIKINRTDIVDGIVNNAGNHKHFVLHGEGGTGKTGVIKDLFAQIHPSIPLCIRKAQSLNVNSLTEIFSFSYQYRLEQFIAAYSEHTQKFFVIDSAEKLQEIEDDSSIRSLIKMLDQNGWSIILTVRNVFLKDLKDTLHLIYNIDPHYYSIDCISDSELQDIAKHHSITLPQNSNFKQRLTNLFYLNLFIQLKDTIDISGSYRSFKEIAWHEKISGKHTLRGIGIKREICFIDVVKQRVNSSKFYIREYHFDAEALQKLIDDEIIARSPKGLFITHDIYEEWGLEKFISQKWQDTENPEDFFGSIGSSYIVRRAFRLWLTECIEEDIEQVKPLLYVPFNAQIESIWQDEVIVAILLSNYANTFINTFEIDILANEGRLFNRIVFLLQLACKQYSGSISHNGNDYPVYTPYGKGWEAVINFFFEHKKENIKSKYIVDVLIAWTLNVRSGIATRNAGLIALEMWANTEQKENILIKDELSNNLSIIICNAAQEIKTELLSLIKTIIDNHWVNYKDPYYYLCQFILTQPNKSQNLIIAIPEGIIKLADVFWKVDSDSKSYDWYEDFHEPDKRFGIRQCDFKNNYTPAGAMQSPAYWLLMISPQKTINFILEFVNYCVQFYQSQAKDFDEIEEVLIFHKTLECHPVISSRHLWQQYRCAIHIVIPDLFQSIHMALEKFLLQLNDQGRFDIVKHILTIILEKSKSISTIAIVASIVCANPSKYWSIALLLFKTRQLFGYDNLRYYDEQLLKNNLGLYTWGNIEVAKERIESLEIPSRKISLESLCIQYQYFGYESISDEEFESFSKRINQILDKLYEEAEGLSEKERHTLLVLLHRIDRRKHQPTISTENKQIKIEFNPQVPKELEEKSATIMSALEESARFLPLVNWTLGILQNKPIDENSPFNSSPSAIIEEVTQIITAISNDEQLYPTTEYAIYNAVGILLHRYPSIVSREEREFCHDGVWHCIDTALHKDYFPQIHDGLEECTHALPTILHYFPEEKGKVEQVILNLLLNLTPLGEYKRICDYAIETINEANWFTKEPELASKILSSLIHHLTQRDTKKIAIQEIPIEYIEIIFAIIPPATIEPELIQLTETIIPIVAETLEDNRHRQHMYTRFHNLYRVLANYVLSRPIEDIPLLLKPLLTHIRDNNKCESLLEEFIYEEDRFPRIDAFWTVWKVLYPPVSATSFRYHNQIIKAYLFSSAFSSTSNEWHSLRECDLWIFSSIANDCGESPSALYSISRLLNYWASKFITQGIEWLYTIINNYPELDLKDDEANTIFYLERVFNKYILENRMSIKQTYDIKKKIMVILTFMIERNSTQAYMLREQIA